MMNIRKINGQHVVYKVVYNDGTRLCSAMNPKLRSGFQIANILRYRKLKYEPYQLTVPKVGKIFAFSTLKDAKVFRNRFCCDVVGDMEVWKATSSRAVKPPFECMPDLAMPMTVLRKWWKGKVELRLYGKWGQSVPDSTVICDDLTLWRKKC
jgi:hypothetical protein